jgi:hypothetical protein
MLAGLLASGCTKDPARPSAYALTGRVRLIGYAVAADAHPLGTRVVEDASGVPVELLRGGKIVARTTTSRGEYRFDGLSPGSYYARSAIFGPAADATREFVIATSDVAARDTIELASAGDLVPVPNPIGAATAIFFAIDSRQQLAVRVLDVSGTPVRTLASSAFDPGLWELDWDLSDSTGAPATGALFWVTFESGNDRRAHLLLR